jgi:hypothetical protein
LVLDGRTTNYVDAAFVQSNDTLVSDTIQGLGAQNNTVVEPFLGQAVCKSGRTSGVTCGTVTGITMTVNVNYGQSCGTARLSNMIMYSPSGQYSVMSQPGDSGSPVVEANTNAAVALNFAGTQAGDGIGIPIGTVLSALQVSLCGNISSGSSSVPTTVTTSPSGQQISVDGTTLVAPQVFNWPAGSSHTLGVPSPQSVGTGTRYLFSSWNDGGTQTHSITAPTTSSTYTASFTPQYQLTTSASPSGGGIVPNCLAGCWYNSGTSTSVTATANAGYTFNSWSGAINSTANPAEVTMTGAKTVTANFTGTAYYSISGTVNAPSGAGIPGVLLTLGGAGTNSTTTNSSGNYSFTGAANGSYTITPSMAGYTFTPTSRVVTVNGVSLSGQIFSGTNGSSSLPNLTPYQPTGWSDKIVVSNRAGTTTDANPLHTTDSLYIDWAVVNNGTSATTRNFYTILYVDGVQRASWNFASQLPSRYYISVIGYSLGRLASGTHTIKLIADATGLILESNKADNAFTKTIIVQ